jgi:ribosomal-protein-alanine N-acetyltransferase
MSACLQPDQYLQTMCSADLAEVMALEQAAYPFPWTQGNFVDSLQAGYVARVLRNRQGELLGYFIAMAGVDEMHLLNLTVAPAEQGKGHALCLLDELVAQCRALSAAMLWLEVRTGNQRARRLYERYGFREIGLRRGYYPAGFGRREDAVVMSLSTAPARAALGGPLELD